MLPGPFLNHFPKRLVYTSSKCLQGWQLNCFPGKPVPGLHNLFSEDAPFPFVHRGNTVPHHLTFLKFGRPLMMMMQVRYLAFAFAVRGMTEPWDHKRFTHVSDLIRYPVQWCSHLLGLALHCPPGCQLTRCNLSPNGQALTFFQLLSPCGSSLVVPHHIKWDHLLTWV